jgi:DNA-binding response OmpR family regulator
MGDGMNDGASILIVDDEPRIVELVRAYLEKDGFGALCASSGGEALDVFGRFRVSLVLLDLMLPDISGEAVCRRMREGSNVPIIMMTAKAQEECVVAGLALGADDYIVKPFSLKQLVARVRAALRRSGMADGLGGGKGRRLVCGALALDGENRRVERDGEALPLTADEYKLLELFMTHPAKVFTRDEIIDKIKGDDYDGFDRTIDAHIKNLRQKIGDNRREARYVQTVYGMGYRFAGRVDG